MRDAQALLAFAAANAKKVEDGVRNTIIAVDSAIADESLSVAHEQEFVKAYEGLTVALAPITAETLSASRTTLPTLRDWRNAQRWSFGRFVDALIFLLVLVGTCISLNYYFQGASMLKRLGGLNETLAKTQQELPAKEPDSVFAFACNAICSF